MALVMDRPEEEEVPLWRRLYHKATTAAAYAVAERSPREPGEPAGNGKDCNVCDKETAKLKKAKKRRYRK